MLLQLPCYTYMQHGVVQKKPMTYLKKNAYRTIVSWNTIILGNLQSGLAKKALETFQQMQTECIKPMFFSLITMQKWAREVSFKW